MYTMTVDGNKLYDPTLTEYGLESPHLQLEANRFGALTFTIYDWNPRFSTLQLRKSIIRLYRDNALYMVFRPVKRRLNFMGGMEYECEELSAVLNDILKRPAAKTTGTNARSVISATLDSWLENASEETAYMPRKDYAKGILNYSSNPQGEFRYLRPDTITASWDLWLTYANNPTLENLDAFEASYAKYSNAVNEIYKALYALGHVDVKMAGSKNFDLSGRRAVLAYMTYAQGAGLMPASLVTASKTSSSSDEASFWQRANNTSNQTGVYYVLLSELRALIASGDDTAGDTDTSGTPIALALGSTPASYRIASSEGNIDIEANEYIGHWNYLQENLVDVYGGYILPVWSEGTTKPLCTLTYVDETDLPLCSQSITFGENMIDLFIEGDTTDMFSTIIPVAPGKNWSIKQYNNNMDFLADDTLYELFGRKEIVKEFENAASAQDLYLKAVDYLIKSAPVFRQHVSATAIDLAYAGVDVGYLTFMQQIEVKSSRHGISEAYPILAVSEALDSPSSNTYELGIEPPSVADQINGDAKNYEVLKAQTDANTAQAATNAAGVSANARAIDTNYGYIVALSARVSDLEG